MGVFHSFSLIELVLTLLALGLWKFIQLNDSINAVQTCVSFISRLIQSVMCEKVSWYICYGHLQTKLSAVPSVGYLNQIIEWMMSLNWMVDLGPWHVRYSSSICHMAMRELVVNKYNYVFTCDTLVMYNCLMCLELTSGETVFLHCWHYVIATKCWCSLCCKSVFSPFTTCFYQQDNVHCMISKTHYGNWIAWRM